MADMKIGFIGAGNMASAIIKGVVASKIVDANNIWASDRDEAKIEKLKKDGVRADIKNASVYENADIIIFAVKPNIYPTVLKEASECIKNIASKLIITIAPSVSTEETESYFENAHVVRVLPNTPAMVGEGMSVMCAGKYASDEDIKNAETIFGGVGRVMRIDEAHMTSVVAVSSSSPAYVFMMIEAMADAGVWGGIGREASYELAAQAVLGSAKMVLETKMHPAHLKDMVCSPAGTTIEAVGVLEEKGFRSALIEAMKACTKKTEAMGKKK